MEGRDVRTLPFDQRQRYEVVAALVRALTPPCRVLDVGGFYQDIDGTAQLPVRDMVRDARSIAVDLERRRLPGYAIADAGQLPFPSRSFDIVSCLDVLEHVPRHRRPTVIGELLRSSRGYLVIAVPLADDGAAGREEALQRFIVAHLGNEQQQLLEHESYGLPTHAEMLACLPPETQSFGYGNLDRWTVAMLAKHFLMALPHHAEAFHRLDQEYGDLDSGGDRRPPFYRRFYLTTAGPDAPLAPIDLVCASYRQLDPNPTPTIDTSDVLAMTFKTVIEMDSSRLAAERAPLLQQVAASQTHIQNLDAMIASLQSQLEGLQIQVRNQEQALEDAQVHIRNLEGIIRNLEGVIGELNTQVAARDQTLAASQTHIVNLEAIIENRETLIDNLRTSIQSGEQTLEASHVHIRNIEAALTSAEARADALRSTLAAVEQSKVYRFYRLVNRLTRS